MLVVDHREMYDENERDSYHGAVHNYNTVKCRCQINISSAPLLYLPPTSKPTTEFVLLKECVVL